jgi:hypothetical protein
MFMHLNLGQATAHQQNPRAVEAGPLKDAPRGDHEQRHQRREHGRTMSQWSGLNEPMKDPRVARGGSMSTEVPSQANPRRPLWKEVAF